MTPAQFLVAGGGQLGLPMGPGVPTCYPARGAPRELDFWVFSRPMLARVREVRKLEDFDIATHRPVVTEVYGHGRVEVQELATPRTFPDFDKQQLKEARWNPGLCDEGALGQRWARWSEEAERFLLSAAAAQPASAAAFKGRGAPPRLRRRALGARVNDQGDPVAQGEKEWGKMRRRMEEWQRSKEQCRPEEERKAIHRALVRRSLVRVPPQDRKRWEGRIRRLVSAPRMAVLQWIVELRQLEDSAARNGKKRREEGFRRWASDSAAYRTKGKLSHWVGEELAAPLVGVLGEAGHWIVNPSEVAKEFAKAWGRLWRTEEQEGRGAFRGHWLLWVPEGHCPGSPASTSRTRRGAWPKGRPRALTTGLSRN